MLAELARRGVLGLRVALALSHEAARYFEEAEPRPRTAGERGRRGGAARPAGPARWEPPPEALRRAPRRSRGTMSRSSAESTSATVGATILVTVAIRRSAISTTISTVSARRWHDLQLEVRGPAVDDIEWTVRGALGRSQPTRHPQPVAGRAAPDRRGRPHEPSPLRPIASASPCGPHGGAGAAHLPGTAPGVPVRRRRRAKHRPGLPQGVPSVLAGSSTSRTSTSGRPTPPAACCATRSRREPELQIVVVIPRYPDPDGVVAGDASRIGRERVLDALDAAATNASRCTTSRTTREPADLRALEGVRRGRPLDRGRLRQPQPPVVDPRLGALVRGDRLDASTTASRSTRPAAATARGRFARDIRISSRGGAPRTSARRSSTTSSIRGHGSRRSEMVHRRSTTGMLTAGEDRDHGATSVCTPSSGCVACDARVAAWRTDCCSTPTVDQRRCAAPTGSDRSAAARLRPGIAAAGAGGQHSAGARRASP